MASETASTEVEVSLTVTVRVAGEFMTDEELAEIMARPATRQKLGAVLAESLRLDEWSDRTLGWTPDAFRSADVAELTAVTV